MNTCIHELFIVSPHPFPLSASESELSDDEDDEDEEEEDEEEDEEEELELLLAFLPSFSSFPFTALSVLTAGSEGGAAGLRDGWAGAGDADWFLGAPTASPLASGWRVPGDDLSRGGSECLVSLWGPRPSDTGAQESLEGTGDGDKRLFLPLSASPSSRSGPRSLSVDDFTRVSVGASFLSRCGDGEAEEEEEELEEEEEEERRGGGAR